MPRAAPAPPAAAALDAQPAAPPQAVIVQLGNLPCWAGPHDVRDEVWRAVGKDRVIGVRLYEGEGRFGLLRAEVGVRDALDASCLRAKELYIGDVQAEVLPEGTPAPRGERVRPAEPGADVQQRSAKRLRAQTPPLEAVIAPPPPPPAAAAMPQQRCCSCGQLSDKTFPAPHGPACYECLKATYLAVLAANARAQEVSRNAAALAFAPPAQPAAAAAFSPVVGAPPMLQAVELWTSNVDFKCDAVMYPCVIGAQPQLPAQLGVTGRTTLERACDKLSRALQQGALRGAWEVQPPAGAAAIQKHQQLACFGEAFRGRLRPAQQPHEVKSVGVVRDGLPPGDTIFLLPRAESLAARQLLGLPAAPPAAALLALYVAATPA